MSGAVFCCWMSSWVVGWIIGSWLWTAQRACVARINTAVMMANGRDKKSRWLATGLRHEKDEHWCGMGVIGHISKDVSKEKTRFSGS